MSLPEPPLCLAMLICDAIHRDPGTGKFTILGTFNSIMAPQFPMQFPPTMAFLALTEFRGNCLLKVALIWAGKGEIELFSANFEVNCEDPLEVIECPVPLPEFPIPGPGEYRLQLSASGHPLVERRIMVVEGGAPPANPSEDAND